jgi:NAD(P)-dependent dehydrogenase (short-subunit alcohol dehydrogenase family)
LRLLDGKVVIVTGAGFGIGRAHALELAEHGAAVVVNDLGTSLRGEGSSREPAEHVAAVIRERGGRAVANFEDVADWAAAGRMVEQAVDELGHLDGLVTNAAIFRDAMIEESSEEDWDSVIRVHLKGTAAPLHHAIRYWKAERAAGRPRGASIVTTTSVAGLVPGLSHAVLASYVAAKAGVAALTQLLSFDLSDHGIRINALSPTAYTRNPARMYGRGSPAVEADEYPADAPFDPFAPSGNSPLVAYLLSDRSQHVSGQVFRMQHGSTVVQMTPWQFGPSATTNERWDVDSLAAAMDREIFGSRLWWPPEAGQELGDALARGADDRRRRP